MKALDWDDLISFYSVSVGAGAQPIRALRAYLQNKGVDYTAEEFEAIRQEVNRRISPPPPAPTFPPPPAAATPAAPVALPPSPAPEARQEPSMSSASDLGVAIQRALPAALSLYRVALDDGTLGEIAEAVTATAKRAARLARRSPLSEGQRAELRREAREEIQCVMPSLPESALETLGEVVIDAIDAHTNTGPIDEIDGEIAKRGLAALIEKIDLWSLDAGNLEARVQRAQRRAERAQAEADRLQAILERRRARG